MNDFSPGEFSGDERFFLLEFRRDERFFYWGFRTFFLPIGAPPELLMASFLR
jgi:hypothetical protein